jgi:hypothetical protein
MSANKRGVTDRETGRACSVGSLAIWFLIVQRVRKEDLPEIAEAFANLSPPQEVNSTGDAARSSRGFSLGDDLAFRKGQAWSIVCSQICEHPHLTADRVFLDCRGAGILVRRAHRTGPVTPTVKLGAGQG